MTKCTVLAVVAAVGLLLVSEAQMAQAQVLRVLLCPAADISTRSRTSVPEGAGPTKPIFSFHGPKPESLPTVEPGKQNVGLRSNDP